jgi:HD domain
MTVPRRREAASLLLSLEPPAWFLRHACAVADVAAWLAARVSARGTAVDREAVAAAALLHDVDKLPNAGADARLPHGEGSAAWMTAHGLGELAPLVRDHPVTCLANDALASRLSSAPLEARLVAYADKRAGQHLESMDERFASWRRRYPIEPDQPGEPALPDRTGPRARGRRASWDAATVELVAARADKLERDVCAAAGISPEEVARLRWSRRALRAAATRRGGAR